MTDSPEESDRVPFPLDRAARNSAIGGAAARLWNPSREAELTAIRIVAFAATVAAAEPAGLKARLISLGTSARI
jgi:hypothetical protein